MFCALRSGASRLTAIEHATGSSVRPRRGRAGSSLEPNDQPRSVRAADRLEHPGVTGVPGSGSVGGPRALPHRSPARDRPRARRRRGDRARRSSGYAQYRTRGVARRSLRRLVTFAVDSDEGDRARPRDQGCRGHDLGDRDPRARAGLRRHQRIPHAAPVRGRRNDCRDVVREHLRVGYTRRAVDRRSQLMARWVRPPAHPLALVRTSRGPPSVRSSR